METTYLTKEDVELGICPFCGASAVVKSVTAQNGYEYGKKVTCARCGAGTSLYKSMFDCIEAWNKRVN